MTAGARNSSILRGVGAAIRYQAPILAMVLSMCLGCNSRRGADRSDLRITTSASASAPAVTSGASALDRDVVILQVRRAAPSSITIDARLNDAPWSHANDTGPFSDVTTGIAPASTAPRQAHARLLWNETGLWIAFEARCPDVRGTFPRGRRDSYLWSVQALEMFFDPDGDNRDYYEIEINPQNLVFDSFFDAYKRPVVLPSGPFGHEDWTADIESAVRIDGSLNDSSDRDVGYVVEARIGWKSFAKTERVPPQSGDTWRMNLYSVERQFALAWSPILGKGSFHLARRFGRVVFVD